MQTPQFDLHAQIEQQHWWFVARRRIMRTLIEQVLPPDPETMIVDVGCGTGANLAALADDYRCVGIDTSADAIERARRRFPQVQFIQGFAPQDLGDAAEQARLFLLMDVMEHVGDDFALFSELLSAASPGSYFLVTVPADESLWSPHDESFGHYRRYDDQRLAAVWTGLPVTVLLQSYYNSRLYPVVRTLRTISRLRGKSAGSAGTDFSLPRPRVNALLERAFFGEANVLTSVMRGVGRGYRRGVSLVALLRRETGPVEVRNKPESIAPDLHVPAATAEPEAVLA